MRLPDIDVLGKEVARHAYERMLKDVLATRMRTLWIILSVVVYLVAGALAYMALEADAGWDFFDGLYFSVTTISTVGFGDLNPSTGASRVFTVIYGTVGICVTFSQLTVVVARVQENAVTRVKLTAWSIQSAGKRMVSRSKSDIDDRLMSVFGRVTGAVSTRCPALAFYCHGMWPWILLLITFQVLIVPGFGFWLKVRVCAGSGCGSE